MITLNLPRQNVVRLSTKREDCRFEIKEDLVATVSAHAGTTVENLCVTVEWFSPRGGHFLYGLLGAQCERVHGNAVELHVGVGKRELAPSVDTLVGKLDSLHAGLLRPYAEAVLRSGTLLSNVHLPAMNVKFDAAVHGDTGSSALVFERLAEVVMHLFVEPMHAESEKLGGWIADILLR